MSHDSSEGPTFKPLTKKKPRPWASSPTKQQVAEEETARLAEEQRQSLKLLHSEDPAAWLDDILKKQK
jgi:hypothetical protein